MDVDDKASKAAAAEPAAADSTEPAAPAAITLADIKRNVGLIVRATDTNQNRVVSRAIRNTTAIRSRVTGPVLAQAVELYVTETHPSRDAMLSQLKALPEPAAKAAAVDTAADAGTAAESMDTTADER